MQALRAARRPVPERAAEPVAGRGARAGSGVDDPASDPVFDEALARIRELSVRLHAVLDLHDPRRTLLGARVCRCCSRPFPCPTVRAGRAAG